MLKYLFLLISISGFSQVSPLPNACDLLALEDIELVLGIDMLNIRVKDASEPSNDQVKSCFFQWDDPNTPNAGILINIQTNTVKEEEPNFFTKTINEKLVDGEIVLGSVEPVKYFEFKAGTKSLGAYNFEQGRLYWNHGDEYLLLLAFNISTLTEEQMLKYGERIVAMINANFVSKVK